MAEYFSHDYGARNDPKLINLQMKLGHEGKGIFWDLVEIMYEQGGIINADFDVLGFQLHSKSDIVKSVVCDFDLFRIDGNSIYSDSIIKRIELRASKSEKYSDSAKRRWANHNLERNELKAEGGQFYVILCYNDEEEFIKIGITETTISRRFSKDKMPYDYKIIAQYFSPDYIDFEVKITEAVAGFKYVPAIKFGGSKECYSIDCIDIIEQSEYTNVITSQCNFKAIQDRRNPSQSKEKERKGKEKKVNKIKEKDNIAKQVSPFYSECIDIYFQFVRGQLKTDPIINGAEGAAMKGIIAALEKVQSVKDGIKEVPEVWRFILENYPKWDKFYQKNIKLVGILSNLTNIINGIKGNNTGKIGRLSITDIERFVRGEGN